MVGSECATWEAQLLSLTHLVALLVITMSPGHDLPNGPHQNQNQNEKKKNEKKKMAHIAMTGWD